MKVTGLSPLDCLFADNLNQMSDIPQLGVEHIQSCETRGAGAEAGAEVEFVIRRPKSMRPKSMRHQQGRYQQGRKRRKTSRGSTVAADRMSSADADDVLVANVTRPCPPRGRRDSSKVRKFYLDHLKNSEYRTFIIRLDITFIALYFFVLKRSRCEALHYSKSHLVWVTSQLSSFAVWLRIPPASYRAHVCTEACTQEDVVHLRLFRLWI